MKCSKCPRYSFQLKRCVDGKVPAYKIQKKSIGSFVGIMGLSSICAVDAENYMSKQKLIEKLQKEQENG